MTRDELKWRVYAAIDARAHRPAMTRESHVVCQRSVVRREVFDGQAPAGGDLMLAATG